MSRRRPRSLCLYSCSAPSLTSAGLEMFFTLCGKTMEVKKTHRVKSRFPFAVTQIRHGGSEAAKEKLL